MSFIDPIAGSPGSGAPAGIDGPIRALRTGRGLLLATWSLGPSEIIICAVFVMVAGYLLYLWCTA